MLKRVVYMTSKFVYKLVLVNTILAILFSGKTFGPAK